VQQLDAGRQGQPGPGPDAGGDVLDPGRSAVQDLDAADVRRHLRRGRRLDGVAGGERGRLAGQAREGGGPHAAALGGREPLDRQVDQRARPTDGDAAGTGAKQDRPRVVSEALDQAGGRPLDGQRHDGHGSPGDGVQADKAGEFASRLGGDGPHALHPGGGGKGGATAEGDLLALGGD
jgi:hypothetical protein